MVRSAATTLSDYLAALPPARRAVIAAVRSTILAHLPKGYDEAMQYGMIGYQVPLRTYPPGLDGTGAQPLPLAALAAQQQYGALYLMGTFCGCEGLAAGATPDGQWFREAWLATGKPLDMGKACVRFRQLEEVPLAVVGQAIARTSVAALIAHHEASRPRARARR